MKRDFIDIEKYFKRFMFFTFEGNMIGYDISGSIDKNWNVNPSFSDYNHLVLKSLSVNQEAFMFFTLKSNHENTQTRYFLLGSKSR